MNPFKGSDITLEGKGGADVQESRFKVISMISKFFFFFFFEELNEDPMNGE
jgi:hypothetical protein